MHYYSLSSTRDVLLLDKKVGKGGFNISAYGLEHGMFEALLEFCISLELWAPRKEKIKGKNFLLLYVILKVLYSEHKKIPGMT